MLTVGTYKIYLKSLAKKIHFLTRTTPYMSISKRKLLVGDSFLTSELNYCPLTYMCHSLIIISKINRLHERCLRIIYNDKTS